MSLHKYDLILTGNAAPSSFKGASVAMPISLPLPNTTQSFLGSIKEEQIMRLRGILEWIMKSGCKLFAIELADYLQRFAVMSADNLTEEEAIAKVDAIATPFFEMLSALVEEFKQRIASEQIPLELKIVRWRENLNNGDFQKNSAIIDEQAKDEGYLKALGETALAFQKGSRLHSMSPRFMQRAYDHSLSHVSEECKVYLAWSYNIVLYPCKATPAIEETYKLFIQPKNTEILHYVTFKLNNSAKKHVEQLQTTSNAANTYHSGSSIAGDLLIGATQYLKKNPSDMMLCISIISGVLKNTYPDDSTTGEKRMTPINVSFLTGDFGLFPQCTEMQSEAMKKSLDCSGDITNGATVIIKQST